MTTTADTAPAGGLTRFGYEGVQVRVVTRDGDPWFVAADVARILGDQETTVISEGGLYQALVRSRALTDRDFLIPPGRHPQGGAGGRGRPAHGVRAGRPHHRRRPPGQAGDRPRHPGRAAP